ncbi:tetratricopeptide repeat protein [Thermoflexus sp.]|uniref:tetratricopeptide repeat protein n=1 Tax=Thermoflexus sp. TaxID=1969742 RepID=UPI002ADDADE5|nr:tetratricopeptide repeat protein [Thermoflexus sp.]
MGTVRRVRHFGPWLIAAFLLLGAGVWLWPYGWAIYHTERGMALIAQALRPVFSNRLAPEHVLDPEQLNRGIAHLHAALEWDPHHRSARMGLARAYAAQNRPELAMKALAPALEQYPRNPLFWLAWGDLHDMQGNTEAAIQAYERGYVGSRAVPLVANYLKLADAHASQGNGEQAIRLWQRVLQLDPGNLYALYQLWRFQRMMGDTTAVAERMAQLRAFREESIRVPVDLDFRLARFQGIAMARLVEEGIWEAAVLERVVRAQAARFSAGLEGLMTEQLLRTLHQRRPGDLTVKFALAEVLQRRGAWDPAEALYREIAEREPEFASAFLRLGMIAESRASPSQPEAMQQAAQWYRRYLDQVPEDLLGLRRWTEICGSLWASGVEERACEDSVGGRRELTARTEDSDVVASLLRVPKEDLVLGPNLLANGGFEDGSSLDPEGWSWSDMSNHPPWNAGLFLGKRDDLEAYEGQRAVRVDGIWAARDPGREGARAGYWAKEVPLRPGLYLLSFAYRTQLGRNGWAGIWVSDRSEVLFAGDLKLPDTRGAWRRAMIIGKNQAEDGKIAVLLRLWGEGTVFFDEVAVREIRVTDGILPPALSLPVVELR